MTESDAAMAYNWPRGICVAQSSFLRLIQWYSHAGSPILLILATQQLNWSNDTTACRGSLPVWSVFVLK